MKTVRANLVVLAIVAVALAIYSRRDRRELSGVTKTSDRGSESQRDEGISGGDVSLEGSARGVSALVATRSDRIEKVIEFLNSLYFGLNLERFLKQIGEWELAENHRLRVEILRKFRELDDDSVAFVLSGWPDGAGSAFLMQAFLGDPIAEKDYGRAGLLVDLMGIGEAKYGASKVISESWAMDDFEGWVKWSAGENDSRMREQVIAGLRAGLNSLGAEDAVRAYNSMDLDLASEEATRAMNSVIVPLLIDRDVEAAVRWVTEQVALEGAVADRSTWSTDLSIVRGADFDLGSSFISQLLGRAPEAREYKALDEFVMTNVVRVQPEKVFDWVGRIEGDASVRSRLERVAFAALAAGSLQAAEDFDSSLDEENSLKNYAMRAISSRSN